MKSGNKIIGFIGGGVMGEAMIKGILAEGLVRPEQVIASDISAERGKYLVEHYKLRFTTRNAEVAAAADVLVLSIKPQMMGKVLAEIRGACKADVLVISIAAGVKVQTIREGLQLERIVRAMPNTPGQIGEGITGWTATPAVTPEQREWTAQILWALGERLYLPDERYIDMVTALSGSGPAYIFLMLEALIDAGVQIGLARVDAEKLAVETMRGAVLFAIDSGEHVTQLRNQVTSPGGTTAAGLYAMEKGGLRTAIADGILAAYQRAMELGKDSS